jgi:hypothetical protein
MAHPYERQALARVGKDPTARAAIAEILSVAERFAVKKNSISLSPQLTASGKEDALQEALPVFLKELARANRPLHKMRAETKARRAKLAVPPVDRGDLVAAFERAEIRGWFTSLNFAERQGVAATTRDPHIISALLQYPELAGLDGKLAPLVEQLQQRYVELTHSEELASIQSAEVVLAEVAGALKVAKGEIQNLTGVNDFAFNKLMEPIERQYAAVWLLKNGDRTPQVCEFGADGEATYRLASPDEVLNGVFYKDAAAYHEARAAA